VIVVFVLISQGECTGYKIPDSQIPKITISNCTYQQARDLTDNIHPSEWLDKKTKEYESSKNATLRLPVRDNGKLYTINGLYTDQKFVVATVMKTLRQWVTCRDLSKFKPLRMTINGSGGCGKSVIINTIVTVMRKMFKNNDVVKVVAPTGTAAFNVGEKRYIG
jgi:hypothetical protein